MKAEAWKRQRVWKAEAIPTQKQIVNMMYSFKNLEERSLFIITYLTAGRISEVVPKKFLYKNIYKTDWIDDEKTGNVVKRIVRMQSGSPIIERREKIPLLYPGIRKYDIDFKQIDGKNIMEVSMANRKNKEFKRKIVPIPVDKEHEMVSHLKSYLNKIDEGDPLFSFSTEKARKILAKVNLNPHYLRDIRLTHLVTIYNFNAFQLVRFAGWKNISPAERYVRMGTKDLVVNF